MRMRVRLEITVMAFSILAALTLLVVYLADCLIGALTAAKNSIQTRADSALVSCYS
jgi:hypothetical protein